MSQKTALLAGATGLVGNFLLFKLLEAEQYDKVIVLTRKNLPIKHPKIEVRLVNFDTLGHKDTASADDIFCCLGTTIRQAGSKEAFRKVDFTYPYQIAQLARENGASQFLLVSSMGASASSTIFYSRVKGEIEHAIGQLGYPSYTVFRPAMLLGNRKDFRIGEVIFKGIDFLLTPFLLGIPSLRKYKVISANKVATAMLEAAKQAPDGQHIIESDVMLNY